MTKTKKKLKIATKFRKFANFPLTQGYSVKLILYCGPPRFEAATDDHWDSSHSSVSPL